jgi:hypothetical protein
MARIDCINCKKAFHIIEFLLPDSTTPEEFSIIKEKYTKLFTENPYTPQKWSQIPSYEQMIGCTFNLEIPTCNCLKFETGKPTFHVKFMKYSDSQPDFGKDIAVGH